MPPPSASTVGSIITYYKDLNETRKKPKAYTARNARKEGARQTNPQAENNNTRTHTNMPLTGTPAVKSRACQRYFVNADRADTSTEQRCG